MPLHLIFSKEGFSLSTLINEIGNNAHLVNAHLVNDLVWEWLIREAEKPASFCQIAEVHAVWAIASNACHKSLILSDPNLSPLTKIKS